MAVEDPDGDIDINLENLKADWGTGYPAICAHCGEPIDTEASDEDGETEIPLQLFRGKGNDCKMLQFHWNCAMKRMRPAYKPSGSQVSFSA